MIAIVLTILSGSGRARSIASNPFFRSASQHQHPLRQHESALEVARGDAAMDVLPGLVVLLPPANDELVFLNGYIELVAGESGDRQRDPQTLGLALRPVAPLDIVGRVTVGAFDNPIEHALDLVEAQKEGTGKHGNTRHSLQSPLEATLVHQGPYRHPLISNMGISACGFKDVAGAVDWQLTRKS
ncbi:hypothetical protein ACVWXM_003692 [Bradyrhizobium sp. GM7.3]